MFHLFRIPNIYIFHMPIPVSEYYKQTDKLLQDLLL